MELTTEFKYDLIQSFEYSANGEQCQATNLTIKMPTARLAEHTAIIDQEYRKAAAYIENNFSNLLGDDKKAAANNNEDAESYKGISQLLAAGNSDLNKCYKALKNILTFKIGGFSFCMIDEKTPLGGANFDFLSHPDLNNILGRFIESFL